MLGAGGVVAEPESYRPATDLQGAERGRRVADEIVERTLEPFGGVGRKPAPVRTQTRRVHGDGREDGG